MLTDKVTIGLFSTETGGGDFKQSLFGQRENIERIKRELSIAAVAMGREPPEIVVSVLLVPNWGREGNSYYDSLYEATQRKFLARAQEIFEMDGVTVQDFYNEASLTEAEQRYMHQLRALGSNLDIIKLRAVINNQDRRHLQIDSNTQIHDYGAFYRQTFGLHEPEQMDALNAAYYDSHYVSAHTKVMYTTPRGVLTYILRLKYLEYCEEHQNDLNDKVLTKNSIYSKAFVSATDEAGLTRLAEDQANGWNFHPAILGRAEYRITSTVVTAVNKSWSDAPKTSEELVLTKSLEAIPSVQVGTASCDLECFKYLVKKYTGSLWQHEIGMEEGGGNCRKQLLAISDQATDMTIIAAYYNSAVLSNSNCAIHIARTIPNTSEGNKLTQLLFKSNVSDLYAHPARMATFSSDAKAQTIEDAERRVPAYKGRFLQAATPIITERNSANSSFISP